MKSIVSIRWLVTFVGMMAVGAWLVGFAGSAVAKGKKGGGGGNTSYRLARILFVDSPGIAWDGQAMCMDTADPNAGEIWSYWDHRDAELTADPLCEPCRIDVSGGGRVKFFTTGQRQRWLTLDFAANFEMHPDPYLDQNGDGPNIDQRVYPGTLNAPAINPDSMVDNVRTTITLSTMFKSNATRQPLDLAIRVYNAEVGGWPGAGWSLHSLNDLYILQDPNDADVRTLTTWNPSNGMQDAAYFDLVNNGDVVGTYYFPLEWEMRILPAQ